MINYAKNEVNFSRMPLHKKDWDFYTNNKNIRNSVLNLAFKFLSFYLCLSDKTIVEKLLIAGKTVFSMVLWPWDLKDL